MKRLLTLLAIMAALAPLPALGQVVSARPEDVSIVVYPELYGVGLVMVTETRTIDLPAGPSKIEFRGVADQIVPQTVALQGLPEDVAEQNFDYQLLSRGSLIRTSEGRTVTLVRTNPATGQVTQERARVVSGSNGAVLDIDGRIETLQCSALPERLVFDDLPPGFVATPTLSVDTVSPRAGRVKLTLSYLATGVKWEANYVARLAERGETMDLSSWITIRNDSDTGFSNAPVQVLAGRLQRSGETRATPTSVERFNPSCWDINSGRYVEQAVYKEIYADMASRGEAFLERAPPPAPPMMAMAPAPAPPPTVEDLGDYKLYTLPEPTTLASHQTKQLQLFDKTGVAFDRVYRRSFSTTFEGPRMDAAIPQPMQILLELKNEERAGLGLALPAGDVVVFSQDGAGPPVLIGQPSMRDTAKDLPFELNLSPSTNVQTQRRVVLRGADKSKGANSEGASVEVVVTNASDEDADVQLREQGGRPDLAVGTESHPHTLKDGNLQWQVNVPAHSSVTVSYSMTWRT